MQWVSRRDRLREWHQWFAWRPVRVVSHWKAEESAPRMAWLETLWRRRVYDTVWDEMYGQSYRWEYLDSFETPDHRAQRAQQFDQIK